MASLKYNKVYSRLFTKIEAYDFIELSEDTLNEFLCNWLHSATANPYVRRLFKSFSVDDEIRTITYEMKYSIDELTDEEFVTEILTFGVAISWLEPKVNSIEHISQFFGSKDERFFSQSQHLSELRGLLDDFRKRQRRMIADRGYAWNTYLDGE